jgi:hypothetical protein
VNLPEGVPPNAEEPAPASRAFASGGLSWTRKNVPRWISRVAKGLYGMSALGVIGMSLDSMAFFGLFTLLSALAWPLFILSYILSLTQNAFAGGLEVSRTELIVHAGQKRRVIPLARIAGALVVEREVFGAFVPSVEVELTNGDILTARLPDPRSAQMVVASLGFGPGGRRVHASLAKPTRRLLHPLLAFGAYLVGMVATFGGVSVFRSSGFELVYGVYPLVALALYAGVMRFFRAPEVTLGDDGMSVRRRRTEFMPLSDIESVGASGSSLVVHRRGGGTTIVHGSSLDAGRVMAVARTFLERPRPAATPADRFTHYERGGRVLAEWRAHLAQAMNQASYRHNAATVDEATAVLHGAQATPEQRVGAALALRVAGQPKERIRIAVEAAADDRTREALDAVAEARDGDPDDAVIEKALKRLPSR